MNNWLEKFAKLKAIINKGSEFGIDVSEFIKKIDQAIKSTSEDTLKIALLGSVSDGKTSAIAGILGKLTDDMKIDQEESSDEIIIYRYEGFANIEIIDTPGLFGTKEKELDGRIVKYSDITRQYLSEANILIYVCDAVVPLKDSHVPIMKTILLDYGKLESTIFVLNKMDEASYDLTDEVDFSRGKNIKIASLKKRLVETIGLSQQQVDKLSIVCIAADPKSKGLAYWFTRMESYLQRSHIRDLKSAIEQIAGVSDLNSVKNQTNKAVVCDVVNNVQSQIADITSPVQESLNKNRDSAQDLQIDINGLRMSILGNRTQLVTNLRGMEAAIKSGISGSDLSSIVTIIERDLGLQDGKVTFYRLENSIQEEISRMVESNNLELSTKHRDFSNKYNIGAEILKDGLESGAKALGKITVSNKDILKLRDTLGQYIQKVANIKFKPWEATKVAGNITKGLGAASGAISFGLEAWDYFKTKKEQKTLRLLQDSLKSGVSEMFSTVYRELEKEEVYFTQFAPSYYEMKRILDQRNSQLEILREQVESLSNYNIQLGQWLEEINIDEQ